MEYHTRAAVIHAPGEDWKIVDVTHDAPKAHEVRVRLRAAGMCHSDDHLRTGDTPMRYPIIGGHEGAGIVEAVGPAVERVAVGDRVVGLSIPECGVCPSCTDGMPNLCDRGAFTGTGQMTDGSYRARVDGEDIGGFCALGTFAEHMNVSEYSVMKLRDDISFEVAALLSCGVPTGWGSAVRAAQVRPGETVVVFGSGGVGINAVQGAALSGAGRVVVVDPVALKRETALALGATHAFADAAAAAEFVREATWGRMADHAIVTVGLLTREDVSTAVDIIGKRGQVTLTAMGPLFDDHIQLNADLLAGYEKVVRGSLFGSCRQLADTALLMDLYREGKLKIDELITRRYTFDQINEGYADLLAGENIRGVIIFPDEADA